MSSERDRQILRAREIDKMSTVMITFGVNVVKKNPIKVRRWSVTYSLYNYVFIHIDFYVTHYFCSSGISCSYL